MSRGTLPLLMMLLLTAATASAHDLPVQRSLAIQMHASHAELLLIYSEPPGPRTDRILALYDSDKDGKIEGTEVILARSPMLRRARLGLDVSFTGALTAEKQPQIRFKRDKGGGIAMATYQRIDFVAIKDKLSVDVTVGGRKGTPELDLVVDAGADWNHSGGDEVKKTDVVGPGASKRYPMERNAPTPQSDQSTRDWQPPEETRPK